MIPELEIKVYEMDDVLRDPELFRTVRVLTIDRNSGMNTALDAFEVEMHQRKINAKAIIGYRMGDAVGWALYSRDEGTDHYRFHPEKDDSVCFQVYVRRELRRQGIGSKLLKKAAELSGSSPIRVYDTDAPEFFDLHKGNGTKVESIYD